MTILFKLWEGIRLYIRNNWNNIQILEELQQCSLVNLCQQGQQQPPLPVILQYHPLKMSSEHYSMNGLCCTCDCDFCQEWREVVGEKEICQQERRIWANKKDTLRQKTKVQKASHTEFHALSNVLHIDKYYPQSKTQP